MSVSLIHGKVNRAASVRCSLQHVCANVVLLHIEWFVHPAVFINACRLHPCVVLFEFAFHFLNVCPELLASLGC